MKKVLLSCALLCGMLSSKSQTVSFGVDFESALASTFSYNGASVDLYARPNAAPATGCTPSTGLITGPSLWSSGQNAVGFTTEDIQSIGTNSVINVSFSLYTFNSKKDGVTDCSNLASAFPCTITVTVTILAANGASTVYGERTVNITPGVTSVQVPITATLTPGVDGTPFRIKFDLNNANADCAGVKDVTFAIDDLLVVETEQEQSPLPVRFKEFNANRQNSNVTLTWTTATEQNNNGFNVQKLVNGQWQTVAFVPSKAVSGNSSSDITYSYTDVNNNPGISQYRIQQVDFNGHFAYSDIKAIRGNGIGGKLIIYPNPSTDGKINVVFEDNLGARDVQVSDMQGRIVRSYKEITNNILVIERLTSGFYTIKVTNKNSLASSVQKVVVK